MITITSKYFGKIFLQSFSSVLLGFSRDAKTCPLKGECPLKAVKTIYFINNYFRSELLEIISQLHLLPPSERLAIRSLIITEGTLESHFIHIFLK